MNDLISKGTIIVDGQDVQLEFSLGGDMKFLVMIMGINSATADYACLWCKFTKMIVGIPASHSSSTMKLPNGGIWRRSRKCAILRTTLDV